MRHFLLAIAVALTPFTAIAETTNPVIRDIVSGHILPRFDTLAETSQHLADVAQGDCAPTSDTLRTAYAEAFDAWVSVSHLRFGPTEVNNRAFALAFWPDSRGATPRSLTTLIENQDAIATSPEEYARVSIAARGFYALEFLLYDGALSGLGDADYRCTLVQTVTADIAAISAAIRDDWQSDYAARLLAAVSGGTYRSDEEVLRELFKALTTGLQFTSDTRLGRPLGTFDRPRPTRAESWRSGRSAHNVDLSLTALRDLAIRLSSDDAPLAQRIDDSFDRALTRLAVLDDPIFAGVADPQSRLMVEVIQQEVDAIRFIVRDELGPTLGVSAGFNALDGD
ncbi:imelysin family protein [Roseovarius sp. Pro17]|uniref:imelysin family protein n=1 Tax=Roseovarius sp. Pro17 TaxID=3108175 RepID=UPI002D78B883|nr:imelysin family protein [Roseovarius sp. Pro17]